MAQIPGGNYDGSNYQKGKVLPEGIYPAEIIWSEFRKNKDKTGDVLHYRVRIISGKFKSCEIYDTLNYNNRNPAAERMGREKLESMRQATELSGEFRDTGALHGKSLNLQVGIDPASGQWPEKNKCADFSVYDEEKHTQFSDEDDPKEPQGMNDAPDWVKDDSSLESNNAVPQEEPKSFEEGASKTESEPPWADKQSSPNKVEEEVPL